MPGVGGAAGGGGDAGHDLEGNLVLGELVDFFPAASEDEGVAALEAQHPLALTGELHHQFADFVLRQRVVRAFLADIDALGVAAHALHDGGLDQPVVEHDMAFCIRRKARKVSRSGSPGPAPTR